MSRSLSEENRNTLEIVASILLRCFVITVISLLFVWTMIIVLGEQFYQIHSLWFDISRKEYDLLLFYSLTFIKSLSVVFFLFPFLAIKHYLNGQRRDTDD